MYTAGGAMPKVTACMPAFLLLDDYHCLHVFILHLYSCKLPSWDGYGLGV